LHRGGKDDANRPKNMRRKKNGGVPSEKAEWERKKKAVYDPAGRSRRRGALPGNSRGRKVRGRKLNFLYTISLGGG